ncbi:uncharacterized protein FIBRA_02512 [Fibroporia radiculosa]|uniref:Uncharacterized protein n=1 Tax=Fibroporia radiculosa TaxID=599839 RepID=J4G1R6_9APHY|nr:uncharacterized protein FIBRA_02512 [Fibroporia radiculosa]CCM00478.1 predicted protein [Fibroporia radiculosa]
MAANHCGKMHTFANLEVRSILQIALHGARMWYTEHYRQSAAINYSEPGLRQDIAADGGLSDVSLARLRLAIQSLTPYFDEQAEADGQYFDTMPHFFHRPDSGGSAGTQPLVRYYGLERKGALPAPFPARISPTEVLTVTVSALNRKSPKSRALSYYERALLPIIAGLESLVRATHNATAVTATASKFRKGFPKITHYLIPPLKELNSTRDLNVPLGSIKWINLFPQDQEPILHGGDELIARLESTRNVRTCILIFHPGCDPRGSIVAWVPITAKLCATSIIGYAFPADTTFINGYDITLFGRHHLDYIIAITIGTLRSYNNWRIAHEFREDHIPSFDVLVSQVGLCADEALRLAELIKRSDTFQKKGHVYEGNPKRIGAAAPYGY